MNGTIWEATFFINNFDMTNLNHLKFFFLGLYCISTRATNWEGGEARKINPCQVSKDTGQSSKERCHHDPEQRITTIVVPWLSSSKWTRTIISFCFLLISKAIVFEIGLRSVSREFLCWYDHFANSLILLLPYTKRKNVFTLFLCIWCSDDLAFNASNQLENYITVFTSNNTCLFSAVSIFQYLSL